MRRPRRLRKTANIRDLVRETRVSMKELVYPIFVIDGENIRTEIPSMPDVYHTSIDRLDEEIKGILDHDIQNIMIFGVTNKKDSCATEAFMEDGIVQRAVRRVKEITEDRKSTRLNSSHANISYAVFCLKK